MAPEKLSDSILEPILWNKVPVEFLGMVSYGAVDLYLELNFREV